MEGVWGVPHTPCVRHQPRAARLALRKMEKPRVTRPAQMNSVRMGLAVMMSQTSPTSVASVLVLPRMVATVVEAAVSAVPSFHRFDGCGRRTRTSISGVRTRPATFTHIPPCNTLRSFRLRRSAPQRVVVVLRLRVKQAIQLTQPDIQLTEELCGLVVAIFQRVKALTHLCDTLIQL